MAEINTVIIFFSKDRAMQLDAAISSIRMHCNDLHSVQKFVIFKISSKIHENQYKLLKEENHDFIFVEETKVVQQILDLAESFEFVSFHCDDNIYIRDFSFAKAVGILTRNKLVLAHSFRLGKNVTYSYTKNSPELQPKFFVSEDQKTLCWDWTKMKHRGFGYPLEVSASVYHSKDVLPLIAKNPNVAVGNIESYFKNYRGTFANSSPLLTCEALPSVISVPVNRVGVVHNQAGQTHSYSIRDLASKFSEGFRIDTTRFNNYITNVTHIELEFSFERR